MAVDGESGQEVQGDGEVGGECQSREIGGGVGAGDGGGGGGGAGGGDDSGAECLKLRPGAEQK